MKNVIFVQLTINSKAADNAATHRRRFWHAPLRLRSAIRQHRPPQRAVLSQICCFGECKVVLFQILLDGAEPRGDDLVVFSSLPVGKLTRSSWHLHCCPCE